METPTASSTAQSGIDDGRLGTARLISRLMLTPSNHADDASRAGEHNRFR